MKIHCPECNKVISQYAESCPECGFPLQKFLNENNLHNFDKFLLCPKCAHGQYLQALDIIDPYVKCEYCGEIIVETNEDIKQMMKLSVATETHEQYNERCIELAKPYGKFSQEAFDDAEYQKHESAKRFSEKMDREQEEKRQAKEQAKSQVTCPYCKSTNTKKISTTGKVASVLSFGLLSKKVGKQWYCNNCKSYF